MIQNGDKVTWTHVTHRGGGGMSFRTREGTVTAVHAHLADVKMRNGRKDCVLIDRLRKAGEKTEVTQIFETLCQST